jgi:hypothetical protein
MSKELHKLDNHSLNYPDIHRYLVSRWSEACVELGEICFRELKKSEPLPAKCWEIVGEVNEFVRQIKDTLKNNSSILIDGVSIFRH